MMIRSKLAVFALLVALILLSTAVSAFAQTIDPAVISLGVSVKKRTPDGRTQIEIAGTVKNIGTKDFKSGAGQQSIRVYEQRAGEKDQVVLEKAFTNLKAGESITLRFTRNWDVRRPSNPASYLMQIDLDPDIYGDDNPNNDDVDQTNNRRTLNARTIDERVGKTGPKKE